MRSVVVVERLEAVDDWIDVFDVAREVIDVIELVAPSGIAAFHGPIHRWGFWRQDIEANALVLAGLLELGSVRGLSEPNQPSCAPYCISTLSC